MPQITITELETLDLFASTEATRYYLNGVYLHKKGGKLVAVATDGHRLLRFVSESKCEDFKPLILSSATIRALVAHRKFLMIQNNLKPKDQHIVDNITINSLQVLFDFGGSTVSFTPIDGTFPEYERVFPEKTEETTNRDKVSVNVHLIADFAKVAKKLGNSKSMPVQLYCYGDDNDPLYFEFDNELDGVIMPMRFNKTATHRS